MMVIMNGSEQEIAPDTNLAELVAKVSIAESGIAVAVNDEVVPRHAWRATPVTSGARIEILTAVQGG